MTRILKTKTKAQYLVTLRNLATGEVRTQRVLAKNSATAASVALRAAKKKKSAEYMVDAIDSGY